MNRFKLIAILFVSSFLFYGISYYGIKNIIKPDGRGARTDGMWELIDDTVTVSGGGLYDVLIYGRAIMPAEKRESSQVR